MYSLCHTRVNLSCNPCHTLVEYRTTKITQHALKKNNKKIKNVELKIKTISPHHDGVGRYTPKEAEKKEKAKYLQLSASSGLCDGLSVSGWNRHSSIVRVEADPRLTLSPTPSVTVMYSLSHAQVFIQKLCWHKHLTAFLSRALSLSLSVYLSVSLSL